MISALRFELGKVMREEVRERVVNEVLANIDMDLATRVAAAIGVAPVSPRPARGDEFRGDPGVETSPALSQMSSPGVTLAGRQVAVLAADGVAAADVQAFQAQLAAQGVSSHVVSDRLGPIQGEESGSLLATKTFATTGSVHYDAVYVPGGTASVTALREGASALQFLREAHGHYKTIAASGDGAGLVMLAIGQAVEDQPESATGTPTAGIVASDDISELAPQFLAALARHRHWDRDVTQQMGSSVRP